MKFENLTPSTFATYAIPLANEASKIPGCKVKQHHLCEAAAKIEKFKNWDTLCGEYSKQQPFRHSNRVTLLVDGDDISVYDIKVQYEIDGIGTNNCLNLEYRLDRKSKPMGIKQDSLRFSLLNGYVVDGYDPVKALSNAQNATQHLLAVCEFVRDGQLPSPQALEGWRVEVEIYNKQVLSKKVLSILEKYDALIDKSNSSEIIVEALSGGLELVSDEVIHSLIKMNVISNETPYGVHSLATLPMINTNSFSVPSLLPLSIINDLKENGFVETSLKSKDNSLAACKLIKITKIADKSKFSQSELHNVKVGDTLIQCIEPTGEYTFTFPESDNKAYSYSPWGEMKPWAFHLEAFNNYMLPSDVKDVGGELCSIPTESTAFKKVMASDSSLTNKIIKILEMTDGGVTLNSLVKATAPDISFNSSAFTKYNNRVLDKIHKSKRMKFSDEFGARNVIVKIK